MCAKFGSDRFRNVNLYKVQTRKQTFGFIYKIIILNRLSWALREGGAVSAIAFGITRSNGLSFSQNTD